MTAPYVIGRAIFGGYFLYNGINHLRNTKTLAQYAGSKQVPSPETAVSGTGVLLLASGASLMLGLKPRLGAAGVITFLTGVTPVMHDFWRADDPGERMNNMVNFAKNIALLGSALAFAGANGTGRDRERLPATRA